MFFRPALFASNVAAVGGTVAALVVSVTDTTTSTSDLAEYTFATRAIGTAAANRYVLVGISARQSTSQLVTAVTVGGVSAVEVGTYEPETGTRLAFWAAAVPTGTTADIVVTFDGAMARVALTIWKLTNLQSTTATDSGGETTAAASAWTVTGIDVSAGGAAFGIIYNAATNACSWTELVEDSDALLETSFRYSAASKAYAAAQTNLSIVATIAAGAANATGGLFVVAMR